MTDYSEAITRGVLSWLDKNKEEIINIVKEAVTSSISLNTEKAIDQMTMGVMVPVAKFFDCNTDEIKTAIAAAIATSWAARNHPSPGVTSGSVPTFRKAQ